MPAEDDVRSPPESAESAVAEEPTDQTGGLGGESDEPKKVIAVPVPPLPPAPAGQQLQVALGMQFVQQSALQFEKLDSKVQHRMLDLVEKMDLHAFESAQAFVKYGHEQRVRSLAEAGKGRKQVLITISCM